MRREADALLAELVSLAPAVTTGLEGSWRLAFATRGTVVTRSAARLPFVDVTGIQQNLTRGGGALAATNNAEVSLPAGASFLLSAVGVFDERDETVSFSEFAVAPSMLFGLAVEAPFLRVPVPPPLRRSALFRTVYLDERARVARGQTGNLFFFTRMGS